MRKTTVQWITINSIMAVLLYIGVMYNENVMTFVVISLWITSILGMFGFLEGFQETMYTKITELGKEPKPAVHIGVMIVYDILIAGVVVYYGYPVLGVMIMCGLLGLLTMYAEFDNKIKEKYKEKL